MTGRTGFEIARIAVLSLLFAGVIASCGQKTTEQTTESVPESSPPPTAEAPPADATAPPDTAITDGSIAGVVIAANLIDIENAQLAQSTSRNDAVRTFATQMLTDHAMVNAKTHALAEKIGVTVHTSDVSRSLTADANSKRNDMKNLSGEMFDKAYIDNEVEYHQAVIDMIDGNLAPRAQNAELRGLLESVRPSFVAHLNHAKTVQAALIRG